MCCVITGFSLLRSKQIHSPAAPSLNRSTPLALKTCQRVRRTHSMPPSRTWTPARKLGRDAVNIVGITKVLMLIRLGPKASQTRDC